MADYSFDLYGEKNTNLRIGSRAIYQEFEDGRGVGEFKWDVTLHSPIFGVGVGF